MTVDESLHIWPVVRVDESCKTITGLHFVVADSKIANIPEHFSHNAQQKSDANDVQIIASKKQEKKGNVLHPF